MDVKVHLINNRERFVAVAYDESGKRYLVRGTTGGTTVESETSAVLQVLAVALKRDWNVELYYGGASWKWADGIWCCNKEVTQNFREACAKFRESHSLKFMGRSDDDTFSLLKKIMYGEWSEQSGFGKEIR